MGRVALVIATVAAALAAAPAWAETAMDSAVVLNGAAFAPRAGVDTPRFEAGEDLDRARPFRSPLKAPARPASAGSWSSEEITVAKGGDAIDTVRLSVRQDRVGPSVGVISQAPYDAGRVALDYTRGWPEAVSFTTNGYDLALTPHAGVGLSDRGASAEAGAMLKLGPGDKVGDRLRDFGVSDGSDYGDAGRWYLFAAASGRAVGLNMTRAEGGGWSQAGWSTDKTSRLVGDGQLGVGFRKGAMQAAFGYVYREIKVQNGPRGADNDVSDSLAAFSLSIRP